jgi:H+/Cl- antiporter ClcA
VGGVLFALEEMTSWFRNQLLWYAFFTTAVVSVAGALQAGRLTWQLASCAETHASRS